MIDLSNFRWFNDQFEQIRKNIFSMEQIHNQIIDAASLYRQFAEQINFVEHLNTSMYAPKIPQIELPVIDFSYLYDAFKISEKFAEIVGLNLEWKLEFSEQISRIANQYNEITKGLALDLSAFTLARNLLPLNDIFQPLIHLLEENQDIADAFSSAKWSVAPSMSIQLKRRVVSLYQQGKSRYISNAVIGFYSRGNFQNLKSMVETWRTHPQFIARIHIIDDALSAHTNNLFTLSVPALFPLIEGILNDYVIAHNLPTKCGKIKKVYEAVFGEADGYNLSQWAIVQTLLFQLEHNTYTFTDFETELKKSVSRRQVSRHTVLHGISTNYDTSVNSLRIFVLLDAISALHNQVSTNHAS